MTKVLLIYENIPESTDIYMLDVEDEDLKWMKQCHRHFVNYEMPKAAEKACEKLMRYLEGKEKLHDTGPVDIKSCDLVIISGFGM